MSALFCVEVNKETSKLVQTLLFEKGFDWAGDKSKKISHTDKNFIFVWDDKAICYGESLEKDDICLTIDDFLVWYNTGVIKKCYRFKINNIDFCLNKDGLEINSNISLNKIDALVLAKNILKIMDKK